MTLTEAAALHFPRGPITAATLRRAHARGELRAATIAGRLFTTPADVAAMVRTVTPARRPQAEKSASIAAPRAEEFARRFWDRLRKP